MLQFLMKNGICAHTSRVSRRATLKHAKYETLDVTSRRMGSREDPKYARNTSLSFHFFTEANKGLDL